MSEEIEYGKDGLPVDWVGHVEPEKLPLQVRVERLEKAVTTMAWWLVQAQTGFGDLDARGIEDIIRPPVAAAAPPEEPTA